MFFPKQNATSTQRASPPKRGAAEPVNLKTHRNPAKTAQGPFVISKFNFTTFLPGFLVFSKLREPSFGQMVFVLLPKQKDKKKATAVVI
jgi:hypothetical protein